MRKRGIIIIKREKSATEEVDTTTDYYVHPAFTNESSIGYANGGWDKELTGIWVAKFEVGYASENNSAPVKASSVNYSQSDSWTAYIEAGTKDNSSQPARNWLDGIYGSTRTAIKYPTFQPITYSMNYINANDAYNVSRTLTESGNIYGLSSSTTDSHLMKNSEWGAVAYLCYSEWGAVPMTNGAGILNSSPWYYYNLYTGQGPKSDSDEGMYSYDATHNYSTSNGVLSSTTRNVTGVYDMAGGAWERVAGYLDNSNGNLEYYGKSDDGTIQYFQNGKLNSRYASLWDSYEVSEEEKNNKITLSDGTVETGLWDGSKTALKYQEARYKLTKYNYDHMANHKGIGVNEVSSTFAFYAPSGTNGNWNWFTSAANAVSGSAGYGYAWDGDLTLIGHLACPFVRRGGDCASGSGTGVLSSNIADGYPDYNSGFRAALVV